MLFHLFSFYVLYSPVLQYKAAVTFETLRSTTASQRRLHSFQFGSARVICMYVHHYIVRISRLYLTSSSYFFFFFRLRGGYDDLRYNAKEQPLEGSKNSEQTQSVNATHCDLTRPCYSRATAAKPKSTYPASPPATAMLSAPDLAVADALALPPVAVDDPVAFALPDEPDEAEPVACEAMEASLVAPAVTVTGT